VVITGASSGIGRATAHAFAREGARLVLAARSEESLAEVVAECAEFGATAIAVPTDVGVEADLERLVTVAIERFGRIDVWLGAASVYAYGSVEETPSRAFARVFEVNLLAQVNGVKAVLPRLGSGAVIILMGSAYSLIATPYVSAYIASKHGLLGFAKSLRQELRPRGVRVSVIMPTTIDTPIYQHAANYTGHEMRPLPPYVDAQRVARAITRVARWPRRTKIVGVTQRFSILASKLLGPINDRLVLATMNRVAVVDRSNPIEDGTLFDPEPSSNAVDGGWRSRDPRSGT
jgi:NAD(P)-dependent dehydrogenase (short-subunit alcohol dehydrogenase family)